ncbi:hypothetical protein [Aquiflexum gelatinilyticum]|uniref:Uncharacterized protein n=1 Tax=Aquiflexum gelatinilyticum TaxID=2961943 RepID=A0A9X2SXR1_9BACT|nr:hypothetical protein [Aquiflexum gelatinilyticum]MCR9014207.1 hypothetical protein [Aquiflexum gelatinilyticum]MCS4433659.1 hypothetical protein [Aquiflexum gelatinilyticum]
MEWDTNSSNFHQFKAQKKHTISCILVVAGTAPIAITGRIPILGTDTVTFGSFHFLKYGHKKKPSISAWLRVAGIGLKTMSAVADMSRTS